MTSPSSQCPPQTPRAQRRGISIILCPAFCFSPSSTPFPLKTRSSGIYLAWCPVGGDEAELCVDKNLRANGHWGPPMSRTGAMRLPSSPCAILHLPPHPPALSLPARNPSQAHVFLPFSLGGRLLPWNENSPSVFSCCLPRSPGLPPSLPHLVNAPP